MTWNASFTDPRVEAKANKALQQMPPAVRPKSKHELTKMALDFYTDMLIREKVVKG